MRGVEYVQRPSRCWAGSGVACPSYHLPENRSTSPRATQASTRHLPIPGLSALSAAEWDCLDVHMRRGIMGEPLRPPGITCKSFCKIVWWWFLVFRPQEAEAAGHSPSTDRPSSRTRQPTLHRMFLTKITAYVFLLLIQGLRASWRAGPRRTTGRLRRTWRLL